MRDETPRYYGVRKLDWPPSTTTANAWPDDPLVEAIKLALIEIRYAAQAGADLLDQVFEAGKAALTEDYETHLIGPDRPLVDMITRALVEAALISRCLHGRGRAKPGSRAHTFHSRRANVVAESLIDLDLSSLKDRDVRDSIEHMEEHIERFMALRPPMPRPMLIYNFVITRRAVFPFPTVFCRVYVAEEEAFDNLSTTIRLRPLRDAMRAIADRLNNEQGPEGALMIS